VLWNAHVPLVNEGLDIRRVGVVSYTLDFGARDLKGRVLTFASSLVRAGDIVHVAFCTRMWTPDLTLSVKTNELSHLEQQPTRCDYGACPKNETSRFFLFFSAHWPSAAVR